MTSATLLEPRTERPDRRPPHDRAPDTRPPEALRPAHDLMVLVLGIPSSRPAPELLESALTARRVRIAVAADTMPTVSLAGPERWAFTVDTVELAGAMGRGLAEKLLVPWAEVEVVPSASLRTLGRRRSSSAVVTVAGLRGARARLRAAWWQWRLRRRREASTP